MQSMTNSSLPNLNDNRLFQIRKSDEEYLYTPFDCVDTVPIKRYDFLGRIKRRVY